MQEIFFTAQEYHQDQSIQPQQYRFVGSQNEGWLIERNGKTYLELGPGYVAVQTRSCGVCSTDLARHQLPFPLPQVTGHEVVGFYNDQIVVLEINASHQARGVDVSSCSYCSMQLDIHCPDRLTLGIDRLPGGFSPWVLVPVNSIHTLPDAVSNKTGALIEPLAAAIKAVTVTPPLEGDRVAVLGPRRLGMLVITALDLYRRNNGIKFDITAVMRHEKLKHIAMELGADHVCMLEKNNKQDIDKIFDIVFDTTGNVDGFLCAIKMSKRIIHLKSTNGQPVDGLKNMTSMVINEQSMLDLNNKNLTRIANKIKNMSVEAHVYISPAVDEKIIQSVAEQNAVLHRDVSALSEKDAGNILFGIVSTIDEINQLTASINVQGTSLLRATGCLLLEPDGFNDSDLLSRIGKSDLELHTSRCGDFSRALKLLVKYPEVALKLENNLITHVIPVSELDKAFKLASSSDKSIKVIVETEA